MDCDNLQICCDYAASSGFVLSTEQRAALQSSLIVTKTQQKFCKIELLGKIIGVKGDYFLCQGVGNDELDDRKTMYSLDCVKWGIMPTPNNEIRKKCTLVQGRFTGDPSNEYEYSERNDEDESGEDHVITLKEEDRLAVFVENIFQDVSAVPRGAYIRTSLGQVQKNRSFSGLSPSEASQLSSYFHFRNPVLPEKSLLEKADLNRAIDFLDPIDMDIPHGGSWSIQLERGGGLVVLRSLHWLGFSCYHVPGTPTFGYFYCGIGQKNLDLPFML